MKTRYNKWSLFTINEYWIIYPTITMTGQTYSNIESYSSVNSLVFRVGTIQIHYELIL